MSDSFADNFVVLPGELVPEELVNCSDGFSMAHLGGFIGQYERFTLLFAPFLQGIGHIRDLITVREFTFFLLQLLDLGLSYLEFLLEDAAFLRLLIKPLLEGFISLEKDIRHMVDMFR
jgi:hypothetical protein